MDQLGVSFSSLLEHLINNAEDQALSEFMRMSNVVSRTTGPELQVATELEKEGEDRLLKHINERLAESVRQSVSKARVGDLSHEITALNLALQLLRIRIGVDLVSKSDSALRTTQECRVPIKNMLVVFLTVRCSKKTSELQSRLELKKRAKNTVASPDDGFLDAVQSCVDYTAQCCKLCVDSEPVLSDIEQDASNAFFVGLIRSLNEVGANQIRQVMRWFLDDRRIQTVWVPRADQLGGLTLPRALSGRDEDTSDNNHTDQSNTHLTGLDDTEGQDLDLVLHELSQILSLTHELQKGLLDERIIEFVSAMVKLDELWLTHNITKAVSHAVSIEIEFSIFVNSVVEDIFHVASTSFARAVNTYSILCAQATSNHVAGFLSDGFVEILIELVRRDAPIKDTSSESKASRAVAGLISDERKTPFEQTRITPAFVEALNTLTSACSFMRDLQSEMSSDFLQVFKTENAMGPQLIEESTNRLDKLLKENMNILARGLIPSKCISFLKDALEPRAQPYQLGVAAYEREALSTTWVSGLIDMVFHRNKGMQQCIPTLSQQLTESAFAEIAKLIADHVEERLDPLRFNALGALQFDKDLRSLVDAMVSECNSYVEQQREDADVSFEIHIRPAFKRLRHWAFLVNLERAVDVQEIEFPAKVLSGEEERQILCKRIEPDFLLGYGENHVDHGAGS